MDSLTRMGTREQIGAEDPAARGAGVSVRVLDLPAQFLVTDAPPLAANALVESDPYSLWLAPDRTLVVYETARGQPRGRFVSDVTDGLVAFEISGPRAGEIASVSCTLDPGGDILAHGRCAQTLFGGVKAVLYRHGEGFRLHAERPFAAFLLQWLCKAVTALA